MSAVLEIENKVNQSKKYVEELLNEDIPLTEQEKTDLFLDIILGIQKGLQNLCKAFNSIYSEVYLIFNDNEQFDESTFKFLKEFASSGNKVLRVLNRRNINPLIKSAYKTDLKQFRKSYNDLKEILQDYQLRKSINSNSNIDKLFLSL